MSIDWDKPVQTRDGREVRIYTREGGKKRYPVVGEYKDADGWMVARWSLDGLANRLADSYDLVNVPQQHTVIITARRSTHGLSYFIHASREEADSPPLEGRIACFEHTFTEGEGLGGSNE